STHRDRGLAAKSSVNLVKDERRNFIGSRENRLEREHYPRRLATRHDADERFEIFADIWRDEELDPIDSRSVEHDSATVRKRDTTGVAFLIDRHGEPGAGHVKLGQLALDRHGKSGRGEATRLGQLLGARRESGNGLRLERG